MPKITPLQSGPLAHAARRENGSFFPLPEAFTHPPTIRRSIAALVGRGWAKAKPTTNDSAVAHMERDVAYGVFITPAGCAAIGVTPQARSLYWYRQVFRLRCCPARGLPPPAEQQITSRHPRG